MLAITHVADLVVHVGAPIDADTTALGQRRIVPILGGDVTGAKLRGRVLAGGADFQLLRPDGVTELEARYAIETASGERIYVVNFGFRHGPPEAMARLRRGEVVDPALIYFRTTPRFETGAESYSWLTRNIFAASGARYPDRVELAVYQVM